MDEIWKEIPGKPGYEVSDQGGARKWKSSKQEWWYFPVKPGQYGGIAGEHLHRQIYRTFVGPIPKGMVVRHLNDIPSDNRLVNLAIGTYSDNQHDRYRNNPDLREKLSAVLARPEVKAKKNASIKAAMACPDVKAKISRNTSIAQTKFTSEQAAQILSEFNQMTGPQYKRCDELAAKYSVSRTSIMRIIYGTYIPKDCK